MARRIGAIELSLGFIVAVVFAVILLTLVVTWIQGLFGQVGGLTDDLTQDAHTKLQEQFKSGSKNFAVYPSRREVVPKTILTLSGAVKNNAEDGKSHIFVVNVIPTAASSNVCPGGDLKSCKSPKSGQSLYDYMLSWPTWVKTESRVTINEIGMWDIAFNVPDDVVKGEYMFSVVACWDLNEDGSAATPNSAQCTTISDNMWGGSAQPVTIVLKE
jgi:hypothetical protein